MPRTRWTRDRIAKAAFLAGRSYPADRIASHSMVGSYPAIVMAELQKVGLVPQECAGVDALLAVPSAIVDGLSSLARGRGETVDQLAGRLLAILAAEPALAANVLDDA